jgi:hypothetical protein
VNAKRIVEANPHADNRDGQPAELATSDKPAVNSESLNPFDPANLRLSQDFAATVGIKKELLTVPVKKPDRDWFVRVHHSADYRVEVGILEIKGEREVYLVDRNLCATLTTESSVGPRILFTAINRQGVLFLWPVKLPGADGRTDAWAKSALQAAEMALTKWVRVQANIHLGAYEVCTAVAELSDPTWPEVPFSELLRIAFSDRFITSRDHPLLRRLRGEL